MINNDHVAPADLGTAGQLADPGQRSTMATRARYAEVVRGNLRRAAQELSGRPADLVRKRMTLTKLDLGWDESTGEDETRDGAGRESANRGWDTALHEAVDRVIESFPLDRDRRAKLRATFMTAGAAAATRYRAVREDPKAAPSPAPAQKDGAPSAASPRRTPPPTRGPGRPAAAAYAVFGGRYTLSHISRMSECAVTCTTLRNRLTDPDNPDRSGPRRRSKRRPPSRPHAGGYLPPDAARDSGMRWPQGHRTSETRGVLLRGVRMPSLPRGLRAGGTWPRAAGQLVQRQQYQTPPGDIRGGQGVADPPVLRPDLAPAQQDVRLRGVLPVGGQDELCRCGQVPGRPCCGLGTTGRTW